MAKFIAVRNRDGREVLLNLDKVEMMRDDGGKTIVQFSSGAHQQIADLLPTIKDKING